MSHPLEDSSEWEDEGEKHVPSRPRKSFLHRARSASLKACNLSSLEGLYGIGRSTFGKVVHANILHSGEGWIHMMEAQDLYNVEIPESCFDVAVKVEDAKLPTVTREIAALTALEDCPYVVQLLNHQIHKGRCYFALEPLLPEKNLEARIKACASKGEEAVVSSIRYDMECLAMGLDAMHQAGFVHGAIQPRSLVFTGECRQLKLWNLELVTPVGSSSAPHGPPGFLAPEVSLT